MPRPLGGAHAENRTPSRRTRTGDPHFSPDAGLVTGLAVSPHVTERLCPEAFLELRPHRWKRRLPPGRSRRDPDPFGRTRDGCGLPHLDYYCEWGTLSP